MKWLFFFLASIGWIHAENPLSLYTQIPNIYHPTPQDYRTIQHYLLHGERPLLNLLIDYEINVRNFKLIGNSRKELPQSKRIAINCSKEEKENCIICYASFNKNYPNGLKRLAHLISKSDFKGHFLYHLGGWPDLEGGSLVLAHVPYAFKVCLFKEAKRLGYKRVFWMDTSLIPLISLNEIFKLIAKDGYFAFGNSHSVAPYINSLAAEAFGLTVAETVMIPSCSAGLFGVDFTTEIGNHLIDAWYQAAQHPAAFFSARSEQTALSIILWQAGIKNLVPIERLAKKKSNIKPHSLFLLDKPFVDSHPL